MGDKLPYCPVYVYDYLTDRHTRKLTLAEHGAYFLLMLEQWVEGNVPADPEEAAELLAARGDKLEPVEKVLAQFFSPNGETGQLINSKLQEIRDKIEAERRGKSLGGKRSARVRKESSNKGRDSILQQPEPEPEPEPVKKNPKKKAGTDLTLWNKDGALAEVESRAKLAKERKAELTQGAILVLSYCNKRWDKRYQQVEKTLTKIRTRLVEFRADISRLFYAADGAVKDPWLSGQDTKSKGYLIPSTVFRDSEQVTRLADLGGWTGDGCVHPTFKKMMEDLHGPDEDGQPAGV